MTPEIQSSLIPLVGAFILSLILVKVGERWLGFAVMGGFLSTVVLTVGLNFQPLTSTRKIILCSLALPVLALLLDMVFKEKKPIQLIVLMTLLGLAAVWVTWPVLARQEGMDVWLIGGRVALYAAAIGGVVFWLVRGQSFRESGALMGLAIGTGVCALTAASALYAQLSFALAAATGGLLLVILLGKSSASSLGNAGLFSVVVPLALIGGASTVFAKLPPMALVFLFFSPVFATIPLNRFKNHWLQSAISTLLALVPAIPAVWLTWQSAGPLIY